MFLFEVAGKKVTISDLKVNQSADAAKYKGNAVAVIESTSATIIHVCMLHCSFVLHKYFSIE